MDYTEKRSLVFDRLADSPEARDQRLRELAAAVDRGLEEFAEDLPASPPAMAPFSPFARHKELTGFQTQFEGAGRIQYEVVVRPRPADHDQAEIVLSWVNRPKENLERGLVAAYSFLFFGFTAVIAVLILAFSPRPFEPRSLLVAAMIAVIPAVAATALIRVLFVVPYRKKLTARERIDELCEAVLSQVRA
jgi:hypothetical protein